MKAVQFVGELNEKLKFVLVPVKDWEKLNSQILKFEQESKMKKKLVDAFKDT